MSALVQDTMAARMKKIISLLLIGSLVYAGYMLLQMHRGHSHTSDLQHDALDSHLRLSGGAPLKNQAKTVVVSADGAPIDLRSDKCRRQRYINVERLTATLVVDVPGTGFNVNQFYSTIKSLLSGAQSFIDEVIVVASGLQDPVATQLDRYLASVGVEARLVRSAGAGQTASRAAGAKLAKSQVLVFADAHVIGTVGWLRPLLGALANEPDSIVMPHVNDVSDQSAFATTPERLLAEYTWPLNVRLVENASAVPSHGLYRSPALRGNLFAVRRRFWDELGGYDDALGDDSAAAHLELSIRAWQCGAGGGAGAILMHQCSHVGVRDIHEVARVVKPSNVRYIARLWFGNLETILLKSVGVLSDSEVTLSTGKRQGCRDIETYFNHVAVVPVPSAEAIYFGQLQASTDACARGHDDGRIDLTRCWPATSHSLPSLTFELRSNGHLLTGTGQCMTVQHNSFVQLERCTMKLKEQQLWSYDDVTGRLINLWSNFCAMHVTDPDNAMTHQWRQILMAQNCTVDLNSGRLHDVSTAQFLRWKFINP